MSRRHASRFAVWMRSSNLMVYVAAALIVAASMAATFAILLAIRSNRDTLCVITARDRATIRSGPQQTRRALRILGVPKKQRDELFRVETERAKRELARRPLPSGCRDETLDE